MPDPTTRYQETGKTILLVKPLGLGSRETVKRAELREASLSEIIEAARNLPRAKIVNLEKTEWFEDSYQLEGPGRWLVVPVEGTD